MGLSRGGGVALWRQILKSLQTDIAEDVFRPGDRLPTEFQLASQFGVNRHTVRRALGELEEKGLIRVEQGRGTFVREQVVDYRVGRRTRFTENLLLQNRTPSHEVIEGFATPADRDVAAALGLAPRRPVAQIETVGSAEGRRICLTSHYLPLPRFEGVIEAYATEGSLTKALKQFGVDDYVRAWTRVLARMPTGREAEMLDQARNRPLLVSEAVNIDGDGVKIEFAVTRFNADWVQLVVEP